MVDELVEVVNEKDEIVGKKMKSVCHLEGIWHRISCVILFNSQGKIWLQTRKKGKISEGLLDYSASGHIKAGQNYEDAAYRELKEELGIKTKLTLLSLKTLYGKIDIEGNKVRHALRVYHGKNDGPFKIQESELEKIEAYELDKVKELVKEDSKLMTEGLKVGLSDFLGIIRKKVKPQS